MDTKRAGAITTAGLVTVSLIGLGAFMLSEQAPAPASDAVPVGQIVVVTTTPGSPVADPPTGQALTEPATVAPHPVPTLETDAPHQQATAPTHQPVVTVNNEPVTSPEPAPPATELPPAVQPPHTETPAPPPPAIPAGNPGGAVPIPD